MWGVRFDCLQTPTRANVEFLPTAIILGFSLVGITFGRTAVSQVAAICCYLQLASLVMPNRIRRFLMAPAESLACSAILFVLLWRWLPIASHSMLSSAILTVASAVAAGVVTKYTGAHVAKVIHRGEQSNPLLMQRGTAVAHFERMPQMVSRRLSRHATLQYCLVIGHAALMLGCQPASPPLKPIDVSKAAMELDVLAWLGKTIRQRRHRR